MQGLLADVGSLAISRTVLPCKSLPGEHTVAVLRYRWLTTAALSEPCIMTAVTQLRIAMFI